jgi:selenium metabolism protein YedF
MEKLILQGLSCPQPVLKTKAYLDENPEATTICVVVDNGASAENVLRFLEHQGFEANLRREENEFEVTAARSGLQPEVISKNGTDDHAKTLIVITNDTVGSGDRELGSKLMSSFIKTLPELGNSLWRIIFLNEGIKLTVEGAHTLIALKQLEAQGVSMLVCGTCLEHYKLLEKKKVGETTNMLDVVMSHQFAEKVINM